MTSIIQERFKRLKVCVIIPTFNNAGTLGKVLTDILHYTDQIIVVNDGSTDRTADILKTFPQLRLISFSKNQGKGWALRCGFKKALESGFDYAISIDSWFRMETGYKMDDTQCGYRLYPLRALQKIRFFTNRFEFEIEVIVRAAWKGIYIDSVPVRIFYEESAKRISHFRPFQDFARISILNTVFVVMTVLYIKPRVFFRNLFRIEHSVTTSS